MFSASFLLSNGGAKDQGATGSMDACALATLGVNGAAARTHMATRTARTRDCETVLRTPVIIIVFLQRIAMFLTGGRRALSSRVGGASELPELRRRGHAAYGG
jgi:hypothetical protein